MNYIDNNEQKKYWIWLSLIKGVGSRRIIKLLDKYKTPEIIWNLDKNELLKNSNIGNKLADNILDKELKSSIEKHIEYMNNNDIDIISIKDKKYPNILKQIYDPPISLYIKGNKNILNDKGIGIIGCRNCTKYGEKIAKYFAYNLSQNNINIVSGLAKGIDSYAHFGAVSAKNKTIAVVGNGLDIIYPSENKKLVEKIIQNNGCIISEYPIGTKPEKNNFPARNRIISGISKGIIVVEAKEKSGTLITVDFALEQGRDVFVVPGNIDSINSKGTNELIKHGARLISNINDVIEYINN